MSFYGGASRIGHLYTNSNGTSFKSDINNDLAMPQYKTAEDTTAEVATGIKTPENDTEVNYTDYVNDETLNVDFSEILNNTDVNYDVDLAISNILKGRATDADFDFFVLKNKANRQAFYETTGIKLPEDLRLSNYILNALNNKEKRIYDIYLKHNANDLKQPDSLTQNDEGGIMNMDNKSVREWYVNNVSNIHNQIDKTGTLKEQAIQAFDLRNIYKRKARLLMTDRKTAELLEAQGDGSVVLTI